MSSYRIMWLILNFDFPSKSTLERNRALKFRNILVKKYGFIKKQNSMYVRNFYDITQANKIVEILYNIIPKKGYVSVLFITDKQYQMGRNIFGEQKIDLVESSQLTLF